MVAIDGYHVAENGGYHVAAIGGFLEVEKVCFPVVEKVCFPEVGIPDFHVAVMAQVVQLVV